MAIEKSGSSLLSAYAEQSEEAEACQELFPKHGVLTRQISSGGVAIRTLHYFQGNLKADLEELESLFAALDLDCGIHLSPFAPPHVTFLLLSRGYVTESRSRYLGVLARGYYEDGRKTRTYEWIKR